MASWKKKFERWQNASAPIDVKEVESLLPRVFGSRLRESKGTSHRWQIDVAELVGEPGFVLPNLPIPVRGGQKVLAVYLQKRMKLLSCSAFIRPKTKMKPMNKTIDKSLTKQQWEELRYPVSLQALSEEEGGGWFATIPLLGEATCAADGETVEEALANLEEYRRSLYEAVVTSKNPIPLPTAVTEKQAKPAGKWLMRTSSELHARLQKSAAEAGVSFNTYCIECLSRGHDANAAENAVARGLETLKKELLREVRDAPQKRESNTAYPRTGKKKVMA